MTDIVDRVANAILATVPDWNQSIGPWAMVAARAAIEVTLTEFAARLDEHRPSAGQLAISPEYNGAATHALEWAAKEARSLADAAKSPP